VDAIPLKVIDRWKKELEHLNSKEEQILMQRRIDVYLDQGYGSCYLKDPAIAAIVEESLLDRGFAQKVEFKNLLACEAGESVKPGALAPGQRDLTNQARETGESPQIFKLSPASRAAHKTAPYLGLAPQALCFRLLRRLRSS
jgi:hypothetical protein